MTNADQIPGGDGEMAVYLPFELTQEQVAFLITTMEIPPMPGFAMPETFDEAASRAAARTLQARNLITIHDDNTYSLNPALEDAINTHYEALGYMQIKVMQPDGTARPYWFYVKDGAAVLHFQPEPGLETFAVSYDKVAFFGHIVNVLNLQEETNVGENPPTFSLDIDLLDEGTDLIEAGEVTAAYELFDANGLPSVLTSGILQPLTKALVSIGWPVGVGPRPDMTGDAFVLCVADEAHWVMRPDPESPGSYAVTPMDGNMFMHMIADRLNAFLAQAESRLGSPA